MSESKLTSRFPLDRPVGLAFRQSYARRIRDGFMEKYLAGDHILDVGYRGGDPNAVPITEAAIGVELDYPGYDGTRLPFGDESQDAVLASHVLEHIPDYRTVLADWYRVLRVGGYLVLFLPHKYLFEKRPDIPSRWVGDHRRFYTPASLLRELDESWPINSFRIRHMVENDERYNYGDTADMPPLGCFEIELVVEKILVPAYSEALTYPPAVRSMLVTLDRLIIGVVAEALKGGPAQELFGAIAGGTRYFPPWQRLREHFVYSDSPELDGERVTEAVLKRIVRPLLDLVDVDVSSYVALCHDLDDHSDPAGHWRAHGYFEGRATRDISRDVRDIFGAGVRDRAAGGQVATRHGTVLYLDPVHGDLRHGQPLSSPANIHLTQEGGIARLVHVTPDGQRRAVYQPVLGSVLAPQADPCPTAFEVVDVGRHEFGLVRDGLFLCAEDTGRITLSRTQLSAWETFHLVDAAPSSQASGDDPVVTS
jgi:SAM-dependent methyltransferase